MRECQLCKKKTANPKFCSKSCAASYNNKIPKKIKKKRFCKKCNTEVNNRRKLCQEHNKNFVDWSTVTYNETCDKRSYQKNSRIRDLARRAYKKSSKPKQCIICGYDKHYEVCHIKPINSFNNNTFISEINNLDNLIALCRNHHWELDNGTLRLDSPFLATYII